MKTVSGERSQVLDEYPGFCFVVSWALSCPFHHTTPYLLLSACVLFFVWLHLLCRLNFLTLT